MKFIVAAVAAVILLAGAAVLAMQNRTEEERDPGSGPEDVATVSPGAITEVPGRWYRENVLVTGEAVPIDEERFVLVGADGAILVNPNPNTVTGNVERGERVEVYGRVFGFNRLQLAEVERLLASADTPQALREAPTELESPYINASEVRAVG